MTIPMNQTRVMLRASLLSLPRRAAISLSMALAIALVVCVLAGFLALAKGFETSLTGAGSPSVAVILGGGSNQESGSDLPADVIRSLAAMSGDLGVVRVAHGAMLMSRETVVAIALQRDADAQARTVALRGMDAAGPSIRDGIGLVEGRFFAGGSREIVVGAQLARRLGLSVGDTVRLGALDWKVAGVFSARGSAFESEFWADLYAVSSAFDRQGQVQSLRLRLPAASVDKALVLLQKRLATITGTPLVLVTEADLYAAQSGRLSTLIRWFGWPIALLMAVGATAGALNTMMASVSDRTVEIATVRALGFSRLSAFLATWLEAVLIAGVGAGLGLLVSWLVFNGWQASALGANDTNMAFQLNVTADVMWSAGLLGLVIGIVGGAIPALAASRLPLTAALRARG